MKKSDLPRPSGALQKEVRRSEDEVLTSQISYFREGHAESEAGWEQSAVIVSFDKEKPCRHPWTLVYSWGLGRHSHENNLQCYMGIPFGYSPVVNRSNTNEREDLCSLFEAQMAMGQNPG